MNSPKKFLACLSGLMILSVAMASCGPDVPGEISPSPSVSPSASPSDSASPGASPSPSASGYQNVPTAEPSPTSSASPAASPSPSNTPLPGSSPNPSATPPEIVFGPTGDPGPNSASFTFRARVVTDNGGVVPVARTSFKAVPYNLPAIQQELIAKNTPGPKPVMPQQSDAKYVQIQKVCNSSGCTSESSVDTDAYRADLQTYTVTTLPDWEKLAYRGLEDAIGKASNGSAEVSLVTDANGEAAMRIPAGTWYFSGKYTAGSTVVVWDSIPFTITTSTKSVELIR